MKQLLECRLIRTVCYTLIVALIATTAPAPFSNNKAQAQLLPTFSVAVIDFENYSGVQGNVLARMATDAVVVEMGKTNRYDVGITRSQIKAEMDKLDLRPPLTKSGIIRLGEALSADAVLIGSVKEVKLTGSGATRTAHVTLMLQLIDQASGETTNGAVQTGTSGSRVGYIADDDTLITEAVNTAAFLAVKQMMDYVIPEATVMNNIQENVVMLNKGSREGMTVGMRMIVLRQGEMIGFVEIVEVNPRDSKARVTKSLKGIRPEDKVRAIYDMPAVTSKLDADQLPSGAPIGSGKTKGAVNQFTKLVLGALVVFGLAAMFSGGRGNESGPNIGPGTGVNYDPLNPAPMDITWNASKYGSGSNVLEYQILRADRFFAGLDNGPVAVISDPTAIDRGRTNLYYLYGTGTNTTGTYGRLSTNPSTTAPTATAFNVPAEPYGTTHRYIVRVLLRSLVGTTTYQYSDVSNEIVATAIEPVRATDIISPINNSELIINDLLLGNTNFKWNAKDGGNQYYVLVQPVVPGTGPTWQSQVIYSTGGVVELPSAQRQQLATILNDSRYEDVTMRWFVFCRHDGDTSTSWYRGVESRFVVGGTPPSFP